MAWGHIEQVVFNRGLISRLALARTDIKRTALSAEIHTNWMSRVLGSMMLRPGMEYTGNTLNDGLAVHIPFIFATDDTALLELTDSGLRVVIDEVVVTRAAVSTSVTNGDFSSGGSWTDADEGAAVSTISGGKLRMRGTGFDKAKRRQTVSVSAPDQAVKQALRIVVERGPATLRVGTTSGGDELINSTLGTGTHSIAFTPNAANIYIEFSAVRQYDALVDSCEIEAAGDLILPTPWVEADLFRVRYDQSADVIYSGCPDKLQRKIERRGLTSWSVAEYLPESGPFKNINVSNTTLSASAIDGDITLTSSAALFSADNVGSLFKIESTGQLRSEDFTGEDQFSGHIRVIGTSTTERRFSVGRAGTFAATLTLQRSVGEPGSWADVKTYTSVGVSNYDDGLSNQIVYYRMALKVGDYTSGTLEGELVYASGSITGIVRATEFNNDQSMEAIVLTELGNTDASSIWYEGQWSPARGFPSAPALHEGRLFWGGSGNIVGSVSDAYESFDNEVEGDSAPINRSIGRGPVDDVLWTLPLNRLCFGTASSEWVARSSSFDELLTVSNFNLKDPSSQGSADVDAVKVDSKGFFIQRSEAKLYQMIYNGESTFDYESVNMMELAPEVGEPGLTKIAVQRQPDTRIHCVRSDGKVAILIDQPAEEVLCWLLFETDGFVEDITVLPGLAEDKVYYTVRRTVNGNTVRHRERWALESECQGGDLNLQADSFKQFTGIGSATITGLDHLEGEEVVVWADGKDFSPEVNGSQTTYTVTAGAITLAESVTNAMVGLPYEAEFKSTKLAYLAQAGTALTQKKRIHSLGLIFANVHHKGIKYGKSFDNMDQLPSVMNDIPIAANTVFDDLDLREVEFMGEWDNDSRLHLKACAPRPCTLLAAVIGMKTNEG